MILCILSLGALGPFWSPAAQAPAPPLIDSIPALDSIIIRSAALGEARRINIHVPPHADQRTPLPVLYMPDGGLDEDFPHVVRAVDSLIAAGAIRPFIVVGIPNTQRRRDLTGPTRIASDSAIAPHVGGSAVFRQFIRTELIPAIDRRYRTTRERAIIGESLAGLFVVETFLQEPELFTHYVAFDPSVWWSAGALIDSSAARLASFPAAPRSLFLATSHEPSTAVGVAKLAANLRAAPPRGLRWVYVPRTDLEHSNIFHFMESAGLVDALH